MGINTTEEYRQALKKLKNEMCVFLYKDDNQPLAERLVVISIDEGVKLQNEQRGCMILCKFENPIID